MDFNDLDICYNVDTVDTRMHINDNSTYGQDIL